MRTQDEIVKRIEAIRDDDYFGFQTNDLIEFLDYEHAKPYLVDGATAAQWHASPISQARSNMVDYMEFAWEKANGKRGLSAMRTIEHYRAWLWLDGEDKLCEDIQHYNYYGKPQLIRICQYLGIDHTKYDDGVRENE